MSFFNLSRLKPSLEAIHIQSNMLKWRGEKFKIVLADIVTIQLL